MNTFLFVGYNKTEISKLTKQISTSVDLCDVGYFDIALSTISLNSKSAYHHLIRLPFIYNGINSENRVFLIFKHKINDIDYIIGNLDGDKSFTLNMVLLKKNLNNHGNLSTMIVSDITLAVDITKKDLLDLIYHNNIVSSECCFRHAA